MKEQSLVPAQTGTVNFPSVYSPNNFELFQKMAQQLSKSSFVPEAYRGTQGEANCMVALELSQRIGVVPFMVMQNLDVIQGKPSFSAKFIIAGINASGKYKHNLKFEMQPIGQKTVPYIYWTGKGQNRQKKEYPVQIEDVKCRAWTTDVDTGEKVIGPWISIEMAVKEGWYTKGGSKWPTMPELMLQYRAASFFSRLHEPGMFMGFHSAEELQDINENHTVDAAAVVVEEGDVIQELNNQVNEVPTENEPPAPPEENVDTDDSDDDLI
jgi:hypothetical protein